MKPAACLLLIVLVLVATVPFPNEARGEAATGEFVGLGLECKSEGTWLRVMKVLPNSPAERAGLVVSDRLIAINGEPIAGLSAEQLARRMQGKVGASITLTALNQAEEPRLVKVVFDAVQIPAGVAAAARAHLRVTERLRPADEEAVSGALAREVLYIARAGALSPTQTELLAIEAKKAIARRGNQFAVKGDRLVRQHFIAVNGRKVLGAEESETVEQVVRRELTQALKDVYPVAWEKLDAEHDRREERRRQSDALTRIAALDDALLLSGEQRDGLRKLLAAVRGDGWQVQPSDDEPSALVRLCARATEVLGQLPIPSVELESVLRPSQITAYEMVQSPTKLQIVVSQRVREDAVAGLKANIRAGEVVPRLAGPEAAVELVRRSVPLDELRRRLELLLERLVDDVALGAELDDNQKQKFRLTGKLDLDRYFAAQAELEKPRPGRTLVVESRVILGNVVWLPPIFTEPASAFQKVLHSRLSAEQRDKLTHAASDRIQFREEALLQALTLALADRARLTDDQIDPLRKLLADRLATSTEVDSLSAWSQTMLERLAELRSEEIESLLADWQRTAAREYLNQLAEAARTASAGD